MLNIFLAEREGFEPPERRRSAVFKTAVIDHSTTSPNFFEYQKKSFSPPKNNLTKQKKSCKRMIFSHLQDSYKLSK